MRACVCACVRAGGDRKPKQRSIFFLGIRGDGHYNRQPTDNMNDGACKCA